MQGGVLIKVATCVPRQEHTRAAKLAWLEKAIDANPCDLFLTSQEFFGGHWIMPGDLHMDTAWLDEVIGGLAKKNNVAIGVGASVQHEHGATQDYVYYDRTGKRLGHHTKFANPGYDTVPNGAGDLV